MKRLVGAALALAMCLYLLGCGQAISKEQSQNQQGVKTFVDSDDKSNSQTYPKDALHKAAHRGDVEDVAKILKSKPDPDARDSFGGTALHAAMFQRNIQVVRMLVDYGLDLNAIGPANGYTPLHDAVWGNNPEAIKLLLAKGANPNIRAKDGLTPVEKAKKEGKAELAALFDTK